MLVLLGLRDMSRTLLLPMAVLGLVARFATIITAGAAWWPSATGVPSGRALTIASIPRRGSVTTTSTPTVLSTAAGSRAATRALLLTTSLVTSLPIFLARHQAPHGVRDLWRLVALLKHA
jgi:hypothetical protein